MAASSWFVLVLVIFCTSSPSRGEPDGIQTQMVHPLPSKPELTSTAGPSRTLIGEGETNPIQNRVVHLPTKAPVTFSAGSPRQAVEGRRFRRGILRKLALPLLILLGVKAGLALPVIFGGVALAAFKGLWTGSSALMMTAAMALKGIIPPPKIIIPTGHAHVQDYVADYRRADPYYRDDYSRYGSYGYK